MKKTAQQRPPWTHSHQWIDAVNLEMCKAIAQKIRRNPKLMRIARQNLQRWKRKLRPWPSAFQEWEEILKGNSLEAVLEILTQESEEGQRLRQSDPFIGILTEKERRVFLNFHEEIAA
jgi:hypothetical protein